MRAVASLILVGLAAASLAACSAGPQNGDCVPVSPGSVSDSVTVTGEFGAEPVVEFAEPLSLESTQRTVVIPAEESAAYAEKNDDVSINFSLYNGTTGEQLSSSFTQGEPASFTVNEGLYLAGLIKTLTCSQEGQRIVGVLPPADAFGAEGSSTLGVGGGESLIFVIDVVSVTPALVPEDYSDAEGLPSVEFGEDGVPTVAIPEGEPPAELRVALIDEGDGAVVDPADSVSVNYHGVNWQTGEVFDQSWDSQNPATFSLTGVVAGFAKAIAGRTVGSTVLAVIPPDLGYGPSGGSGSIGADDTIVFVIEILDVTPATGG